MKPILNLTITRKWLEMIASGEKREEYRFPWHRQVARVWREAGRHDGLPPRSVAVFRAGYRMNSPALAVELVGVTVRGVEFPPRREWGEWCAARFVLMLGDVLARGDYAAVRAWMEARK